MFILYILIHPITSVLASGTNSPNHGANMNSEDGVPVQRVIMLSGDTVLCLGRQMLILAANKNSHPVDTCATDKLLSPVALPAHIPYILLAHLSCE